MTQVINAKYAVLLDFVFVMLQTLHMAEVGRIVLHSLALSLFWLCTTIQYNWHLLLFHYRKDITSCPKTAFIALHVAYMQCCCHGGTYIMTCWNKLFLITCIVKYLMFLDVLLVRHFPYFWIVWLLLGVPSWFQLHWYFCLERWGIYLR